MVKGKHVFVKELKQYGIVTKTDDTGTATEVVIDGELVEVIGLTVKIIGLFKTLFLLIKGVFKK